MADQNCHSDLNLRWRLARTASCLIYINISCTVPNKRGRGQVGIKGGGLENRKHRNNFQTFFPYQHTFNYLFKFHSLFFSSKFSQHFDNRFNLLTSKSEQSGNFKLAKHFSQFIKETSVLLNVFFANCRLSQQETESYQ